MRVEILGSAGAVPTPRSGCDCRVCTAAREHGGRHVRTGPRVVLAHIEEIDGLTYDDHVRLSAELGVAYDGIQVEI